MAGPQSGQPDNRLINNQVIVFALALLLPGLAPSFFGWVSGLLATPVFFLLCFNGQDRGGQLIRNGALLAAAAALVLKLVPTLFFSLTFVPLGYSFYRSYDKNNNEIQAWMHGTFILAASWLIFWTVYGTVLNINPYQNLLKILDTGFEQTYIYYSSNSEIPAETLFQLEAAFNELRRIIPTILPGILCCIVIITVWVNLLLSSNITARIQPDKTPWKRFTQWRLPDKLVWVFIAAAAILLLGQESMSQVGTGMLLATALLYFFQGLAVFLYLLEKWKVPVYMRILLYVILILQSYGLILLILAGLADVWFNFRHPKTSDNMSGS